MTRIGIPDMLQCTLAIPAPGTMTGPADSRRCCSASSIMAHAPSQPETEGQVSIQNLTPEQVPQATAHFRHEAWRAASGQAAALEGL